MAGQSYVQQNRNALPKAIGQKKQIPLKTLVEKNYIEPIKDYSDNECDLENSYVQIFKYSQDDYSYIAYLDCPVYDSKEQLEKSGALKSIEVMNNNPSIKWAIKEVQNLERSGILEASQKQFESIGTKKIESLTNISLPVADSIHRELCRLDESTYFQYRHELNALLKNYF